MNAEEFIVALKHVVRDAAIRDTLSILERPPGRNPPQELKTASERFHSLSSEHHQVLTFAVSNAVDSAIFGLLCVIDGVRTAVDDKGQGRFELRYVGETVDLLNDENAPMLHNLYNTR
jgi:hypothetical protein